jgi:pimeloyl-ACP methyl ester carboxylesterase
MINYLPKFKTKEAQDKYDILYDSCLKLWPVPYSIINITSYYGDTQVIISGPENGKPLVLLHGACATSMMWVPNVKELAKHFRVYAIDTIGDVNRSRVVRPFTNKVEAADWLIKVFDVLELKKINVAGMSYGSFLALDLAVKAPDRIEKLIMISPTETFIPLKPVFWMKFIRLMLFPTKKAGLKFLKWSNGNKDIVENVFSEMVLHAMKHGIFRVPGTGTIFKEEELAGFNVPVMILIGKDEVLVDADKLVSKAKQVLKGPQIKVIENASHTMSSEKPEIVNSEMIKFING